MNFDHLITDNTGLLHLVASILSLITGTFNLAMRKGTRAHKRVGYVYTASMTIVLITSFTMYRLFGTWGIFHWSALVSTITLICGLLPVLRKRPVRGYIGVHLSFMYWSVIGLYGAFVAEIMVRLPKIVIESGIPNRVFYNMTGIGVGLVMGLGAYFFIKLKPGWDRQFNQ